VPVLKESAEGYLDMMGKFAAERHGADHRRADSPEVHHEKRYFNGITVVGEGDGTTSSRNWCRLANTCRCRTCCAG
jgi:apolipoprotein N-acyltransferase